MADTRTVHGLTIEFQHSPIEANERISRENFYGDMVWVVDGARLKSDYSRFLSASKTFLPVSSGTFRVGRPEDCFHAAWLGSEKPVIFDFRGEAIIENPKDMRNFLYCLFPVRLGQFGILTVLSREAFIGLAKNGGFSAWAGTTIDNIRQVNAERNESATLQRSTNVSPPLTRRSGYGRSRRL